MPDQPSVILSGFGDEAANQKTAEQQFAAFAAIGLQYYSLRFIDAGQGIKNVMQLSKAEITKIRHLEDEYGLNVATLGSPIGKVKLLDVEDGTNNRYVPFERYLYPRAMEVVLRLWTLGEVAILSDGDRVYQPAKIARAGLLLATRGNVLVYEHKEDHLAEVQRRFPSHHYAHVDDKPGLLSRTKVVLGPRATTVHVRQGHYASEPQSGPPPDVTVDRIADLLTLDRTRFDG